MGAATVGMYRNSPPLKLALSSAFTRPSEPAKSTRAPASSVRPLPDPPPL